MVGSAKKENKAVSFLIYIVLRWCRVYWVLWFWVHHEVCTDNLTFNLMFFYLIIFLMKICRHRSIFSISERFWTSRFSITFCTFNFQLFIFCSTSTTLLHSLKHSTIFWSFWNGGILKIKYILNFQQILILWRRPKTKQFYFLFHLMYSGWYFHKTYVRLHTIWMFGV